MFLELKVPSCKVHALDVSGPEMLLKHMNETDKLEASLSHPRLVLVKQMKNEESETAKKIQEILKK